MTDERGRILVLTVGFVIVIGLLVAVVADTSALFLRRRELDNLADAMALAATEGLEPDSVYGGTGALTLSASDVRRVVSELAPPGVSVAVDVEGDAVDIRLTRQVALPITPPGWRATATITSKASGQLHRTGGI